MKKLILASQSPQRRKLLKFLGLRFTVKPSRAAELHNIKTTCAALVMENARRKAQDVAARLKSGVVIGADTLVYAGNKQIIGKPRDSADARRILKILFSRPSWVYTGVAVIDAARGKTLVDYEKTRVFMIPLTEKEITQYHRRVNPFDKAGGFQIEGWGSIFIHRIEGCYANVIGLPMAKLASMLKKVGISIL
ncbi:MAG: septum formation protein Maf [Candidatus Omnitrophica bacterium]|nr:septum formation protein Maf [Candidatus Omnitrophota bacterium]